MIDELNRIKVAMATLKESYVASCMENHSLKSAPQHSKGARPRNIGGTPKIPYLEGEGFKIPLNRHVPKNGNDSNNDAEGDDDANVNL